MRVLYLLLLLSLFYSCKPSLTDQTSKQNKNHYLTCLENRIKTHKSYPELKSFESYLKHAGVLIPKNEGSFAKLFNTVVTPTNEIDSVLKAYNYDMQYKMKITIPDSCKFRLSKENQNIVDSLNLYMQKESFEQVIDLSQKVLLNLEKDTFTPRGIQLKLLNFLYQRYQYDKIEEMTTLNVLVTKDSLFIEEKHTTLAKLKEHVTFQVKQRKEILKKHSLENKATLKMRVAPDVKMGSVQDIQAILQEIDY